MRETLDVIRRRNILRLTTLIREIPEGDRRRRLCVLLAEEEVSALKAEVRRG